MSNRAWPAWVALGVVYVVWGSTYLAIRFLVDTFPPLLGAGLRFLVAGPVLLVLVLLVAGRGALRMTRAQAGSAALVGLLLAAGGQGVLTVAETQVASGLAALLVACVPLFVLLLRRLLGEVPPAVTVLGVLLGLGGLGVLLLFGGPAEGAHGAAWWGPWLVLIAAASWSVGTVASTRLPMPANPFASSAVGLTTAGVALAVAGLAAGQRVDVTAVSARSWFGLAYLIVAGSLVGYSAYVFVLDRLPLSTVATYAYVNPVIAVLLGVLLAGERFGPAQLAGGVLVLVAVLVVVRAEAAHRAARLAAERETSAPAGTMSDRWTR
ncbi:EamA domain-containing membrane protein RarD [Amycolatopsis arida]|uniref:EamA domain-containing membrane protein RarD n=1 Tax=Amycolatopsis arida TaxID=587909 RepID=A0A1I5VEP6_9PSEU|nr:EamA family transporter [Amycolatopsis arida]TDX91257.1 EamA domain-containing membrane protein RarD [Amycolatopsis arida]SFQ06024.1 EamA domain-containing membrane protein RarD [Amycolatopsis arida]